MTFSLIAPCSNPPVSILKIVQSFLYLETTFLNRTCIIRRATCLCRRSTYKEANPFMSKSVDVQKREGVYNTLKTFLVSLVCCSRNVIVKVQLIFENYILCIFHPQITVLRCPIPNTPRAHTQIPTMVL